MHPPAPWTDTDRVATQVPPRARHTALHGRGINRWPGLPATGAANSAHRPDFRLFAARSSCVVRKPHTHRGTDKGMDSGTDSATDSGVEGRWLTYSELATIRRIDRHSAVKLVIRHRWRRQRDNRGTLRIFVPLDWAVSRDKGTDSTTDTGTDEGTDKGTDKGIDLAEYVAAYRAAMDEQIAALRAVIEAKDSELSTFRSMVDGLSLERDRERQRADALRDRLTTMQEQLADAHAALQAAEAAESPHCCCRGQGGPGGTGHRRRTCSSGCRAGAPGRDAGAACR